MKMSLPLIAALVLAAASIACNPPTGHTPKSPSSPTQTVPDKSESKSSPKSGSTQAERAPRSSPSTAPNHTPRPPVSHTCTVRFDLRGSGYILGNKYTFTVPKGSKLTRAQLLVPDSNPPGYRFLDWYKEPECTNPWNIESDVVNTDITLYPKWGGLITSP